jgi:ABC-type antimicrobial peptide transport system permease subunit
MGLRTVDISADVPSPFFRMVTRDYFTTLGVPLSSGRTFDGSERASDSTISIVINQALAKIFFPGVDPVGRVIPGGFGRAERIIGVVGNIAEANLRDTPGPARYYLAEQVDFVPDEQTIVIKVDPPADATQILGSARHTLMAAAPSVAIREATTMERVLDRAIGPARQVMTLLSVLAGLALALSAIGVYGVISQFVGRRRREWGIRVALGLTPARVVGLVVRRAFALILPGIALGIGGALVLTQIMAALLYGVSAGDWFAFGTASLALLVAGALAALLPALRAGRTDPALVLRDQ